MFYVIRNPPPPPPILPTVGWGGGQDNFMIILDDNVVRNVLENNPFYDEECTLSCGSTSTGCCYDYLRQKSDRNMTNTRKGFFRLLLDAFCVILCRKVEKNYVFDGEKPY